MRLPRFIWLVALKVYLGLKAEASRHHLSYAWWVLEPALETAVFFVVFGIFMNPGIDGFLAFLLVALVPWSWFVRSIQNCAGSVSDGGWLLQTHRLPPAFFPLVVLGQDWVKHLIALMALLGFLVIYGVSPTRYWLFLPAVNLLQLALVSAIAIWLAGIIPGREDWRLFVNTVTLMLMFSSGIFYDPNILVTSDWIPLYFLNPVAALLQIYRDILLGAQPPATRLVLVVMGWALLFGFAATWVMRKGGRNFSRLLAA